MSICCLLHSALYAFHELWIRLRVRGGSLSRICHITTCQEGFKNICKCAFIKGWQRRLGNVHSLHNLYLWFYVGCTQQILHVTHAAPLKHCMSSRLQLSTMAAALVTPPSLKIFPIFLKQNNWVAFRFCISAWLHLANVTCRLADTFVLKCQATGHNNAWSNLSSSMQTRLYDSAKTQLGSAAHCIIINWGFMNISQSAVTGCVHETRLHQAPRCAALMFCTLQRTDVCTSVFCTLFQSTSVTRLVCRVRWCNAWWAGICIKFHHQLMMFWSYSLVLALVLCTSERCTGTWAHMLWFLCTSTTRSVWSDEAVIDDLGCAAYHCQVMLFYDHVVSVSSHHTQQVSAHQAHSCACIDFLHIWAMYLDWARMLIHCAQQSQDFRVESREASIDEICSMLHHQLKM